MAKKSKKDRLSTIIVMLGTSASSIEEIVSNLEQHADGDDTAAAKEYLAGDSIPTVFDTPTLAEAQSLLEELKDEMDSWASGMEDSNLAASQKCEDVRTAADQMDETLGELADLEWPDPLHCEMLEGWVQDTIDELNSMAETINQAISDLEGLEW